MTSPLVSVIMPVHNAEAYVTEAIESVLRQTFVDFELLVINDSSTDKSIEVLTQLASKDPRISILHNRGERGLVPTLLLGLSACRGRYIARMDADDVCLPQRFYRQVEYLDKNPSVGVLGTNISYIDETGSDVDGGNAKDETTLTPTLIRWLLLWRTAIYHPTVMLRASLFDSAKMSYDPCFPCAQDRDLWARLARHTAIASLPEVHLRYRILSTSISRASREQQRAMDRIITIREIEFLLGEVPLAGPLDMLIEPQAVDFSICRKSDFEESVILLVKIFNKFCHQSVSKGDRREIEKDVCQRLVLLARHAASQSPGCTWIVLKGLSNFSWINLMNFQVIGRLFSVLISLRFSQNRGLISW